MHGVNAGRRHRIAAKAFHRATRQAASNARLFQRTSNPPHGAGRHAALKGRLPCPQNPPHRAGNRQEVHRIGNAAHQHAAKAESDFQRARIARIHQMAAVLVVVVDPRDCLRPGFRHAVIPGHARPPVAASLPGFARHRLPNLASHLRLPGSNAKAGKAVPPPFPDCRAQVFAQAWAPPH